jgi:tellurite resistance protein
MKKIADKAKSDGVISEDEYKILEKVSFDVNEYMVFLEKANEDNYIDEVEEKKLIELKKKIVYNAMEVESKDGMVTDEEHELIKEIVRILRN